MRARFLIDSLLDSEDVRSLSVTESGVEKDVFVMKEGDASDASELVSLAATDTEPSSIGSSISFNLDFQASDPYDKDGFKILVLDSAVKGKIVSSIVLDTAHGSTEDPETILPALDRLEKILLPRE